MMALEFESYYDHYFNYLKEIDIKNARILHLGSGWDKHKIRNRLSNADLISFDLDFTAIKRNENRKKICGNGERMPFKKETFDFVISEELVEHIEYPEKLLKEVYFVLKEEGEYISVTPNGYSYIAIISRITPLWFHEWYNKLRGVDMVDVYPTYYRFNSYFGIQKKAKELGYKVKKIKIITGHASYFSFSKILFKAVSFFHYILSKITFLNKFIGINIFMVLKK